MTTPASSPRPGAHSSGGLLAGAKHFRVSASGRVDAPPAEVYAVIADYRRHHPHIVPPEYFEGLDVLEGGVGSGIRTRVRMHVLGKKRVFEQVEASSESASHVTIATDIPSAARP